MTSVVDEERALRLCGPLGSGAGGGVVAGMDLRRVRECIAHELN